MFSNRPWLVFRSSYAFYSDFLIQKHCYIHSESLVLYGFFLSLKFAEIYFVVLLLGKMSYAYEKSMCSTFIGGEFFERVKVVSGNVHVSLSTGPRHTPVQRTGVCWD